MKIANRIKDITYFSELERTSMMWTELESMSGKVTIQHGSSLRVTHR